MKITFMIIAIAIAYLLGNISPAILIGKAHGVDVRKEGSGNAGTTNVLRLLGKKAAAATLLIDILKGVVAVIIGNIFDPRIGMMCALAVFLGHIWPVFFKFKGGKGAATGFGAVLAVSPPLGLCVIIVAAVLVLITKRMSVGSLAAAISLPALSLLFVPEFFWIAIVMMAISVFKHRANIGRLMRGEEPKMNFKK